MKTRMERFWEKVDKSSGVFGQDDKFSTECWIWIASLTGPGYGQFWDGTKIVLAHRFSYEYHNDSIPRGLSIDHLCRTRHCINPEHLEIVTHRENVLRGISPMAKNAVKTHCPSGHEYSKENTYTYKGGRRCKTCTRIANNHQGYIANKDKTHCKYGHKFSKKNTSYTKDGRRQCRECERLRSIKRRKMYI